MVAAKLLDGGRITIPATVRKALGVTTGARIEFIEMSPGRYELVAATLPVTALKGMFSASTAAVSINDMKPDKAGSIVAATAE